MLERIDIKAGDLTYGQRIELGNLYASQKSEVDKFKETFHILHNVKIDFSNLKQMKMYVEYFQQIVDGLQFWFEKEKTLLEYIPEPEEVRAGIKELGEKVGYFGAIKTLAKNYSQDPDDILEWKYGKVFGIIYTDFEEFKYQKRLNKQYEQKLKK